MQNRHVKSENEYDIMADEGQHLRKTLTMIETAIDQTDDLVEKTEKSYQEIKAYRYEFRGEIDGTEMFESELLLNKADRQSAEAVQSKLKLEKLLASPYFARIAFIPDGEKDATVAYIGRFAFSFENRTVVSDWRSPIASLFYDNDLGRASYIAPSGTVSGDLTGKRQIEVEQGKLVFAAETGSSIRDEVLQRELGKSSDKKMKSIISSIQREQNKIIRNEDEDTLIIQGAAGSGKTSIALHRVAYLLYNKKGELSSKHVAILSPNKVFGDYISKVLPELGEEPIQELYLRAIYERILDSKLVIGPQRSFVDDQDQRWQTRARFKGSFEFAQAILDYLEKAAESIFVGQDISFGRFTVKGQWLDERYYGYENLPINERLGLIASDLYLDMHANLLRLGADKVPSKRKIKIQLSRMLKAKDALGLYKLFFKDQNMGDMFASPGKQAVEWEDACPLVFFAGAFEGFEEYAGVHHLVIDEMQDLTPIQHMMMARLFPCAKTLLGDYCQVIDPGNAMELDEMQTIYGPAPVYRLLRSYRSTTEIMDLAGRVKKVPGLESVVRSGEKPELISCGNTQGVLEKLEEVIERFKAGEYKTLGILHKSEVIAQRYFELLPEDKDIRFISQESTAFESGVSVSSIKMTKGLEFDEVVILDADKAHYETEDDRNLLYVAITRAMHRLTILYRTEPSTFIV